MIYSKKVINNCVLKALSGGRNINDVRDLFLSMKMSNDLGDQHPTILQTKAPSTSDIKINLIGNGIIADKDCNIEMVSGNRFKIPSLVIKLSPSCKLHMEKVNNMLQATVNNKNIATISIRDKEASDVAMWIIRQKQNIEKYLEEWETVLKTASKKSKSNHMSMLAIKAVFTDAMKDYPDLKYVFIEQKRRVRIRVKLPNSRLGVFIDAWWGSYKKKLPEQIESLKVLIEAHRKCSIKDFFVSNR